MSPNFVSSGVETATSGLSARGTVESQVTLWISEKPIYSTRLCWASDPFQPWFWETSQPSPFKPPKTWKPRREIPQGCCIDQSLSELAGWYANRLLQGGGLVAPWHKIYPHGHSLKPPVTLLRPTVHQRPVSPRLHP